MFAFVCHKDKKNRQFITSLKERVSLHAFKNCRAYEKPGLTLQLIANNPGFQFET